MTQYNNNSLKPSLKFKSIKTLKYHRNVYFRAILPMFISD